jgi:DNA topoisomerase-6 subunit B
MLVAMLKDVRASTLSQFLTQSFSRVSSGVARRVCEAAQLSPRANPHKVSRSDVEKLYAALQNTRISAPSTDCISPIGEPLLLKGLHKVVPGEFYVASTRPPAVYRGNPFLIEVALSYGGAATSHRVSRETLAELVQQSDARTLRQFLTTTFAGVGPDSADKLLKAAELGPRQSPGRLKAAELDSLHKALEKVDLDEGQSMNILRYANRVPLQFQQGACAITQSILSTNWRSYGLSQSRGSLPNGPVTVMVHMASVWVPFTSESKEAIASYPEILKELRLALQAAGRKLALYLRRRQRVKQEGQRRNVFLRYLGEVATAVSQINETDRDALYNRLLAVAERKTAMADVQFDENGRPIEEEGEEGEEFGDNVLIVDRAKETEARQGT